MKSQNKVYIVAKIRDFTIKTLLIFLYQYAEK